MKKTILVVSLILLFVFEITRVYYIMPFPGSQRSESIGFAYWIHNNILWLRLVLLMLMIKSLIPVFRKSKFAAKTLLVVVLALYALIFYYTNYKLQADKMFLPPTTVSLKSADGNKVDMKKLIIGVVIDGEAKAYPIQVIGYHHQVRDTVGKMPVIVTYCTVCRTGRVYSPIVNGKNETFRLVGMDHFNAMFEDATTKSWWQQATGLAVAGPLKGTRLAEVPFQQSTLEKWLERYPASLVLQPDTIFNSRYRSLSKFDNGTTRDALEKRDSASWKFKSWVVGVADAGISRAYDWNRLVATKLIQDSLPGLPLLITLENDTATFHVLNRTSHDGTLHFQLRPAGDSLTDVNTGSVWTVTGECVSGKLKGQQLLMVQGSQEFWHSWRTFHPRTSRYGN